MREDRFTRVGESYDESYWGSESEEWGERDPYGDSDLWIADDPWGNDNVSESLTLKYLGSQAMLKS